MFPIALALRPAASPQLVVAVKGGGFSAAAWSVAASQNRLPIIPAVGFLRRCRLSRQLLLRGTTETEAEARLLTTLFVVFLSVCSYCHIKERLDPHQQRRREESLKTLVCLYSVFTPFISRCLCCWAGRRWLLVEGIAEDSWYVQMWCNCSLLEVKGRGTCVGVLSLHSMVYLTLWFALRHVSFYTVSCCSVHK